MVRKKVGTITFHVAHNYGAMLQAYALPVALKELGYDAEVIDYRFPYIYNWGYVEGRKQLIENNGFIKGNLKWLKRYLKGVYSPLKKINKFNYFREKIIPHSKKVYEKKDAMSNMEYDAILFGSDQIWNEELTDGVASEFFGDFKCLEKTKKIAYAASCGKSHFTNQYKDLYYSFLRDYSAIGVRESGFMKSLTEDGFNAKTVLDPTLLLASSNWNNMVRKSKQYIKPPKEDYLLVYVFDEEESFYNVVDKLAEKYNLKVVVVAYDKKTVTEKYSVLTECGPSEFVNLIANAKMVITTSFHGTVFSVIYHKDFYCIPHPKYHERTDCLLEMLKLEDRNIKEYNKIDNVKKIDWNEVEEILERERKNSIKFLKASIGE